VAIIIDGTVSIFRSDYTSEVGAQTAKTDTGLRVAKRLLKSELVGAIEGSPTHMRVIGLEGPVL
jgi:hypothetical protein